MKKSKKHISSMDELPKTQLINQVIVNIKPIKQESVKVLPGYEKEDYIISDKNNTENNSVCWNCCHSINDKCYSQPIKYENGVFSCLGNFCSYECICRYTIDSNESTENIFNKLSILNLLVNKSRDTSSITVRPAPSRLMLKMFGGNLDIDEYRKLHENYINMVYTEPIVKCLDVSFKNLPINNNTINKNKKEFKLYRKNKKSSTNDIYASMNLISE